jgi:RNA polymerase primary sigma factor
MSKEPDAKAAPAAKTPVKVVVAKPVAKAPAPVKAVFYLKAAPIRPMSKTAPIRPIMALAPIRPVMAEKVQQLVSLSKKNGYVTVQNINEVIPDSATDPELIENIMNILDNLDIKLLDEDEVETYRKKVEDFEEAAARIEPADAPYDPFDVYLEQVRLKPRVSRARELELFQHITDGEYRAQEFLFSRWLTLPFQLDLAKKVISGEQRHEEVVDSRKSKRNDSYLTIIKTVVASCEKLNDRLEFLWQSYLSEADPALAAEALQVYHEAELNVTNGCKFHLRKFYFRMSLFEEWLDGSSIQDDLRNSRMIVDGPAESLDSAKRMAMSRDIELRWRLSPFEFLKVYEKTRMHLDEVRRTKTELIENNLRLVISIAREFQDRGLLLVDLIQEGNIGLMKTIDRYDHARGYSFSGIATWWIRQVLARSVVSQSRTIRIPVQLADLVDKVVQARKKLTRKLGREPNLEEMAAEMNTPIERMQEFIDLSRIHALSHHDEMTREDADSLHKDGASVLDGLVAEDPHENPTSAASTRLLREKIDFVLRSLAEREKEVLILRFGLIDGVQRTLEEVGRHFKLTRERIRQIEMKALKNLRHPTRLRQLRDSAEDQFGRVDPGFDDFTKDSNS